MLYFFLSLSFFSCSRYSVLVFWVTPHGFWLVARVGLVQFRCGHKPQSWAQQVSKYETVKAKQRYRYGVGLGRHAGPTNPPFRNLLPTTIDEPRAEARMTACDQQPTARIGRRSLISVRPHARVHTCTHACVCSICIHTTHALHFGIA